jgi:hypothetical protein
VLVEQLRQLGEIGQRTGQAVDLVDDDDIDLAVADVAQQPLQRGPRQRGAISIAALTPSDGAPT